MHLTATQLRVKALELMGSLHTAKENAKCGADALMYGHCIYIIMSTMESEASNQEMQLVLESVENLLERIA